MATAGEAERSGLCLVSYRSATRRGGAPPFCGLMRTQSLGRAPQQSAVAVSHARNYRMGPSLTTSARR